MAALGDFVFTRTYSRVNLDKGHKETKQQAVKRVAAGTVRVLGDYLTKNSIQTDFDLLAIEAKFIELISAFKMSPPGRGLWSMSENISETKRGLALVNCMFLGSGMLAESGAKFFEQIMSNMMQGVGAGFDDTGANKVMLHSPYRAQASYDDELTDRLTSFIEKFELTSVKETIDGVKYLGIEKHFVQDHAWCSDIFVIPDTREGWCQAVYLLIQSYIHPSVMRDGKRVYDTEGKVHRVRQTVFDYSRIRPAGKLLKTFGGTASGPQPLIEGIAIIRWLLDRELERDKPMITSLLIVDICNVIATIVVAGNVRRSSEIFLSRDESVLGFKDWSNPAMAYRMPWGWASNNSLIIDAEDKVDPKSLLAKYESIISHVVDNGEPGIFDIDNARRFGRFIDGELSVPNDIDGTNPCGEIGLNRAGETCNLAEVFLPNYVTDEADACGAPGQDGYETMLDEIVYAIEADLWYMVLYCKVVTLVEPDWENTREIQARNRRIGVSLTGIQKFLAQIPQLDLNRFGAICSRWYAALKRYDEDISRKLGIPISVALTTIKPSGTVSICANVPSGMHCPISEYYIRRVRCGINETALVERAIRAGYHVEPDVVQPDTTRVITFYVATADGINTRSNYSAEEQFKLAHVLQTYWCDNQVSVTITFKPDEVASLPDLLMKYPLKGVSFLPLNTRAYAQSPEEAISKEEYYAAIANLRPIDLTNIPVTVDTEQDRYCDGDKCLL